MPTRRPHISLRARATIFTLLVVSLGLSIPAVVMINELRRQVIEEERRVADSVARAAAESAVLPLAVGNRAELDRIAHHFLWEKQNLFVAIFDERGDVVAVATNDETAWQRYAEGRYDHNDWFLGERAILLEERQDAFDELTGMDDPPASGATRPIGWIVTAVSPDRARAALDERTRFTVFVVLAGWLATAPIVWLVVRGWSRRLDRMVVASEQISTGDLDTRIDDPRRDDIGRLSQALERMRRSFQDRERELTTFNERLRQEVAERTSDLETAKRAAEKANRAKSAFLANMSHEIRTPLTAILGYIDLLEDDTRDADERSAQIETIRRNARHLLAIINDILDISKIEAGELLIERIEVDPAAVLSEAVSMTRPGAADRGLELTLEFITPVPLRIRTDPTRLRQILLNLISNALKFTEHGSVRLVASCDAPNERLVIEVIDTGIGMSDDKLDRLFRPFSQADETMTRRFGGTGLGLAISRQLALALGGDVTVQSAPDAGSNFRVTIATGPLDDVEMVAPEEAIVSNRDVRPATALRPIDGARVLLVEDGPDNRRLISLLLRKAGCEVETADHGAAGRDAALAAAAAGSPFAIVLMDMQMPVMDGYTATRELRAAGYDGWIVALTAHAMGQDREKCLAAGCDHYLSKPVDRQSLVETIARLHDTPRKAA